MVLRQEFLSGKGKQETFAQSVAIEPIADSAHLPSMNRGQRTKKTAEVERKLRKALGMHSHEGSIHEAEKTSSSAPRKADTRSSVDSYSNGEVGSGSSGPPEDRDSQRLLPVPTNTATEREVSEAQRDNQAESGGEECEMMEKQNPSRRKDGL